MSSRLRLCCALFCCLVGLSAAEELVWARVDYWNNGNKEDPRYYLARLATADLEQLHRREAPATRMLRLTEVCWIEYDEQDRPTSVGRLDTDLYHGVVYLPISTITEIDLLKNTPEDYVAMARVQGFDEQHEADTPAPDEMQIP